MIVSYYGVCGAEIAALSMWMVGSGFFCFRLLWVENPLFYLAGVIKLLWIEGSLTLSYCRL